MTAGTRIERALKDVGGSASLRRISSLCHLPYPTVRDAADQLVRSGRVVRERGLYTLSEAPLADEEARRLLRLILESGLDAHLTGLDLLSQWWQQFSHRTPHLVYADPSSIDTLTQTLTAGGFVVVPLDRSHGRVSTEAPATTGLVLARGQSVDFSDRFGVAGGRASIEKAWIDAARETRRGVLPLTLFDLGQILGAALASNAIDLPRLRTLAGRAKLPFVREALDRHPRSMEARQLLAGLDSERSGSGD